MFFKLSLLVCDPGNFGCHLGFLFRDLATSPLRVGPFGLLLVACRLCVGLVGLWLGEFHVSEGSVGLGLGEFSLWAP
jgi:hypothetical protein